MKAPKILLSILIFLAAYSNGISKNSAALTPINGIRINFPGDEFFQGYFTDPAGNHLFMFTNGIDIDQGDAWILKMSENGEDTLLRCFSLPDTVTILYTGYYTPQHTYMFFGQLKDDTNSLLCDYCYLWVLETDTLLNVLSSKRYNIPSDYKAIVGMSGYSLSPGEFTLIGTYTASSFTWYSDDIFLAQFDNAGDTLRTSVIKNSLHQSVYTTALNPGGQSFSAIVSGLNVNVDNVRMVVDQQMNYVIYNFIGDLNIQPPLSMIWINDTLFLAAGEKNTPPSPYWNIHICVAGVSGIFYQDLYLGSNQYIDLPAFKQAVIRSADNGYYFAGMLRVQDFQYSDTMIFCRLDENYNITWKKYLADIENFVIQAIFLKPDGNILVASTFYDYTNPQFGRDLIFFTVDSNNVTGTESEEIHQPPHIFTISPNPGNDHLNVESALQGNWTFRLIDLSGREVVGTLGFSKQRSIDVSSLKAGIYLCEISGPDQFKRVYKWIKNNN